VSTALKRTLWTIGLSAVVAIAYAIARYLGLDLGPPPALPSEF
jgi:hypothetical protein